MSHGIGPRASVPELSRQVLEMAQTGVYRESIFEALQPLSTKKNIRLAIAHAKELGMYSIAELRDSSLGTYYQIDMTQYQVSRAALASPLIPEDPAQAVQLATDVLSTLRWIVRLTLFTAILLATVGLSCGWFEYGHLRGGLLVSAGVVLSIWRLQHRLISQFFRTSL